MNTFTELERPLARAETVLVPISLPAVSVGQLGLREQFTSKTTTTFAFFYFYFASAAAAAAATRQLDPQMCAIP